MERSFFTKTGGSRPIEHAGFANERKIPARPFVDGPTAASARSEAPSEHGSLYRQEDNEIARRFMREKGDAYALTSSAHLTRLWEAFSSKTERNSSQPASLLEIAQELAIAKNLVHNQPMSVEQRSELTARIAPIAKRLSQEPYATTLREERTRLSRIRAVFLRSKILRHEQQRRDLEQQSLTGMDLHKENQPSSQRELDQILHDARTCLLDYATARNTLSREERDMLDELESMVFAYEARPIHARERLLQRHASIKEKFSTLGKESASLLKERLTPESAQRLQKEHLEVLRRERKERETPEMRVERKRFEALDDLVYNNHRLYVAYHDLERHEIKEESLEPPEHTLLHRLARYHALEKQILETLEHSPATKDLPLLLAEPSRIPFTVDDLRTQTITVLKRLEQQLAHPVVVDTLEAEEQQWKQLYAAYTAAVQYKEDTALITDQHALGPIHGNITKIFEHLETLMNIRLDQLLKGCLDALNILGAQITSLENKRALSLTAHQKNYTECTTVFARIRRRFDGIVLSHPLIKTRMQGYRSVLGHMSQLALRLDQLTPRQERSEAAFS